MGRKKTSQEEVIRKFKEVHGDEYDYSKVVYTYARAKVTITCRIHGDFEKAVFSHLQGSKCRLCRDEKYASDYLHPAEQFIEKCHLVHGNKYDYSQVSYAGTRNKVDIVCPQHGTFAQEAGHHQRGYGCPQCAKYGFDRTAPAILYVLRGSGGITKIGITNNNVKARISRVSCKSGRKFELLASFNFASGTTCEQVEARLLAELAGRFTPVADVFEGYTECFKHVDYVWLISKIAEVTYER